MEMEITGGKKQKIQRQEVGPRREPAEGGGGWGVGVCYDHCADQNGAGK